MDILLGLGDEYQFLVTKHFFDQNNQFFKHSLVQNLTLKINKDDVYITTYVQSSLFIGRTKFVIN